MANINILEELLDNETNQLIIEELQKNGLWTLAFDHNLENDSCDQGFNMLTHCLAPNVKTYPNEVLNGIGHIIFRKVINALNEDSNECLAVRFLYNYYNRSSSGQPHFDNPDPDSKSIVYYFNTCDGGTVVDGEYIESKSGRAVVFNSNILHYGVGPKIDKNRYVLNILYLKGKK